MQALGGEYFDSADQKGFWSSVEAPWLIGPMVLRSEPQMLG